MFLPRSLVFLMAMNVLMFNCRWMPRLPWDKLRNDPLFVENTYLMEKYLNSSTSHPVILRGYRGFGKTTQLELIKCFMEQDFFPNGTKITNQFYHKHYNTFSRIIPNSGKFLQAFLDRSDFEAHFGKYPVIFLDLDLKETKTYNRTDFVRHLLAGPIRAAFEQHSYLLNSTLISSEDKERIKRFLHPNLDPLSDEDPLRNPPPHQGIILLKELLKLHFQTEVVTLIDNADAPLQEIIFDPAQHTDEALQKLDVVGILLNFIPDFGNADNATAPSRTFIACTIVPNHIADLSKWRFLDLDGFTKPETQRLAKGLSLDQIWAWYGGFGEDHADKFNPDSVTYFLINKIKEFRPYWSELGSLDTFKTALAPDCFGQQILECFVKCHLPWEVSFESYWMSISPDSIRKVKDLQRLKSPVQPNQCPEDSLHTFVSFLSHIGYMRNLHRGSFQIPNLEVKQYLSELLYNALVSRTPLNGDLQFKEELFQAIAEVNGSEASMRRFGESLVTLLLASDHGIRAPSGTLAHSVRIHLLRPPTGFNVKYVKVGRSKKDISASKTLPELDLVFALQGKNTTIGFVVKIETGKNSTAAGRTLTEDYLNVFQSELKNVTEDSGAKVAANLCCDEVVCKLNYIYFTTHLDQEKHLTIEKARVGKEASGRWRKFPSVS